ncbi:daptide biosynthesis intramembrane metalloprotease [Streptomyces sp. NPDC057424]|uniref:daptide biosynthesis intramembrane metalloprotease n=1 Tax=Streptomyces sp. NPDC057424 TaxID=3346127 RepID=UPI0036C671E8
MSYRAGLLRRRPAAPAPADGAGGTAHLERARLAEGVRVHPPVADGEPWVLQRGEHQYYRIGADLASLADRLDGTRDVEELADGLGRPWTPETVREGLRALDRATLVVRPQDGPPPRRSTGRFKYVPPLTLQFTVLRSGVGLARLINRLRLASPRTLGAAVALLAVMGAFTLVGRRAHAVEVLSRPVSLSMLMVVLAAVSVTTVAHELGHACLLAHYGGRPGRLGVMFFYLSPAMFCDVSDAWRLNHRQRAHVAMAGIFVQLGASGAAACASGLAGDGPPGDMLLLFSLVNAAAAVINLVPFVKLDGYIALMSYLDHPNLRADALRSLRERFTTLLTGSPGSERPEGSAGRGGRGGRRDGEGAWLPWFGAACLVTPVLLVVRGLGQWLDALLSLGYFGLTLSTSIAGLLAVVVGKAVLGLVRSLRGTRPRPLRVLGLTLVIAAVVFGVSRIHVTTTQIGAYRVTGDAQVVLTVPTGPDGRDVRAGDRVELVEAGLVLRRPLGEATVVAALRGESTVPLTGLVPVDADQVKVPGRWYTLRVQNLPEAREGSVRLHPRSVSLPRWAYERFVLPFAAPFN